MTKTFPISRDLVTFALAAVATAIVSHRMSSYIVDDGMIYAHFAEQLLEGHGWTFNAGSQPVYATTSPLWTMLLYAAGFCGVSLISALICLSAMSNLSAAVAAGFLLSKRYPLARAGCTLTFALLPMAWRAQGLDVVLAVGLCSWAIYFYVGGREVLAGGFIGFAMLARPDSALLALVLLSHAVLKKRQWPIGPMLVAGSVVFPWLIYAQLNFDTIIPATLGAKTSQRLLAAWAANPPFLLAIWFEIRRSADVLTPLAVVGVIVTTLRWLRRSRDGSSQPPPDELGAYLFMIYGMSHALSYAVLDVPSNYFWYLIPGLSSILVGAFLGVCRLNDVLSDRGIVLANVVAVCLITLVAASFAREIASFGSEYRLARAYQLVALEAKRRAKPTDRIATAEIGYIGYYSGLRVLDIHGLIHPEKRESIRSGNALWWLQDQPEWIVTHTPRWFGEPGWGGVGTEVLNRAYAKVGQVSGGGGAVELWWRNT